MSNDTAHRTNARLKDNSLHIMAVRAPSMANMGAENEGGCRAHAFDRREKTRARSGRKGKRRQGVGVKGEREREPQRCKPR